MLSVAETVAALADGTPGLTVVADVSDNAGGGAASDSTWILAALLEAGVEGVTLGAFWDPVAVRLCAEAGEGSRLALRVGGKVGPMSGPPVDLEATVRRVVEDASQQFGGGRQPMGTAVLVEAGGLQLLLNSVRTQIFHPDAFTQLGVDFAALRGAVVKSAQHFHAGFAPLASRVLYAAAPGTMSPDMRALPLTRAARPLWPKVDDPYA
jgi:microcystin degradation protein MlrC